VCGALTFELPVSATLSNVTALAFGNVPLRVLPVVGVLDHGFDRPEQLGLHGILLVAV